MASSSSTATSPSPSRQASTTPDPDMMQIFVKNVAGETTPLTIPSTTTIAALTTLLPLPLTSTDPQTLRLIHAGSTLSTPDATLASLNLPSNATLHLALPLRGGSESTTTSGASTPAPSVSTPKRSGPRKPRCSFKDCREKPQPIVGECGFCEGKFCSKHRMLESHACRGMEECKDAARKANTAKLEGERTRPQAAV